MCHEQLSCHTASSLRFTALLTTRRSSGCPMSSWLIGDLLAIGAHLAAQPVSQAERMHMDGRGLAHWVPNSGVPNIEIFRVCPSPLNLRRLSSRLSKNRIIIMKGAEWSEGQRTPKRVSNTHDGIEQSGMPSPARGT